MCVFEQAGKTQGRGQFTFLTLCLNVRCDFFMLFVVFNLRVASQVLY